MMARSLTSARASPFAVPNSALTSARLMAFGSRRFGFGVLIRRVGLTSIRPSSSSQLKSLLSARVRLETVKGDSRLIWSAM